MTYRKPLTLSEIEGTKEQSREGGLNERVKKGGMKWKIERWQMEIVRFQVHCFSLRLHDVLSVPRNLFTRHQPFYLLWLPCIEIGTYTYFIN